MKERRQWFGDSGPGSLDSVAEVPTPENVAFRYELAGPFQRLPAFLVDAVIRILILLAFGLLAMFVGVLSNTLAMISAAPALLLVWFLLEWFYGGVLESLWNGQTIGKRLLRIRVVSADGRPVDGMQAILRNLLRALDIWPWCMIAGDDSQAGFPTFAVGFLAMAWTARYQRIGDLVAGTMVIVERDRELRKGTADVDEGLLQVARLLPASLIVPLAESRAVLTYCERHDTMYAGQRGELVEPLVQRWQARYNLPDNVDGVQLMRAMHYRLFVSDQVNRTAPEGGAD